MQSNKSENVTKELTKAELELMRILWNKKKAFLGDIVEAYPVEHRPAYPTISTVVRILEKKGFIGHESFSKVNRYYPLVAKEDYRSKIINNAINVFFDNSPRQLFTYFAQEGSLSVSQYEDLKDFAEKLLKK
ncbi:MAG: BlaI/MecI/CopY family transcriptional regulator [Bacteroidales bacterium]